MATQGLVNMMLAASAHNDIAHHNKKQDSSPKKTRGRAAAGLIAGVGHRSSSTAVVVQPHHEILESSIYPALAAQNLSTIHVSTTADISSSSTAVSTTSRKDNDKASVSHKISNTTSPADDELLFKDCVDEESTTLQHHHHLHQNGWDDDNFQIETDPLTAPITINRNNNIDLIPSESALLRELFGKDDLPPPITTQSLTITTVKNVAEKKVDDLMIGLNELFDNQDILRRQPNNHKNCEKTANKLTFSSGVGGGGIQLWNGKFWKRPGTSVTGSASKIHKINLAEHNDNNDTADIIDHVINPEHKSITLTPATADELKTEPQSGLETADNNVINNNNNDESPDKKTLSGSKFGKIMVGTAKNLLNFKLTTRQHHAYHSVKAEIEDESGDKTLHEVVVEKTKNSNVEPDEGEETDNSLKDTTTTTTTNTPDRDSFQIITECSNPNFHGETSINEEENPNKTEVDETTIKVKNCYGHGTVIINKLNSLTKVFGPSSGATSHSTQHDHKGVPKEGDEIEETLLTPRRSKPAAILYPWHQLINSRDKKMAQFITMTQTTNAEDIPITDTKAEAATTSIPSNTQKNDSFKFTNDCDKQRSGPVRFGTGAGWGGAGSLFPGFFFYSRVPDETANLNGENVTKGIRSSQSQNRNGNVSRPSGSCSDKNTEDNTYPLKPVKNLFGDEHDGLSFAPSNAYFTGIEIPDMEELFNEPKNFHSYDLVWNSSKSLFGWLSLMLYRLCTAVLAVPFSLIWAIIMSLTCVLNVWLCTPIVSFLTVWMELLQRIWWSCCKTCITPIVEAFMLGKWNAVNSHAGGFGCSCPCNKNPQHAINFGNGKNGDVIMTNGTGVEQSVKELETKP